METPCHISQSLCPAVIPSVECVPRSLRAEKRIGSTRAWVKLKFPLLRESLGERAIAAIIAELKQIFPSRGPCHRHRHRIAHCVGNLTVHLCGRQCGMPQASRLPSSRNGKLLLLLLQLWMLHVAAVHVAAAAAAAAADDDDADAAA